MLPLSIITIDKPHMTPAQAIRLLCCFRIFSTRSLLQPQHMSMHIMAVHISQQLQPTALACALLP